MLFYFFKDILHKLNIVEKNPTDFLKDSLAYPLLIFLIVETSIIYLSFGAILELIFLAIIFNKSFVITKSILCLFPFSSTLLKYKF